METNWQLFCIVGKGKGVVVQINDLPGFIILNINHPRVDVTNKLIVRSSSGEQFKNVVVLVATGRYL